MEQELARGIVGGLRKAGVDVITYLPETRLSEILPLLRQTLRHPRLRKQVLFGTDFYVVRNHKSDKNMLADMMCGRILVESALGRGSIFTLVVTFPIADGMLGELWDRPGEGGSSVLDGIDLVVAITVSWIPLAADYTRFTRTRRAATSCTGSSPGSTRTAPAYPSTGGRPAGGRADVVVVDVGISQGGEGAGHEGIDHGVPGDQRAAGAFGAFAPMSRPNFEDLRAKNDTMSAMIGAGYIKAGDSDGTRLQVLVEPSYHMPFSNSVFGFLGVGAGLSYLEGPGAGLAIAPRIGANVMVGRSGVLSPYLSYAYTTHDSVDVGEGMTLLAVSAAVAANVGYTVMW